MRLLWFNLATDLDDPILGFTSSWIKTVAKSVDFIDVITMRKGRVEAPKNVRVVSIGKEKGYSEPRRGLEFYRELFGILGHKTIDVCFSHMIPIFTVLAAPVLRAKGIPIVMWYAHPSLTQTLKLADRLSDRIVTSVATAYPYKRNKLIVVGQGIDTDLFSPDGQPAPDTPPMILCAGRLSAVKNHATLLKAASLLRRSWGMPFQVAILGGPVTSSDGPYAENLYEQVKDLEIQKIIRFEPPISMEALPSWYQRCTVHVNLTPTGFGDKVALEAMSCARPSLLANGGFRETLGKYSELLHFRHGDSQDLADRIERVLSLKKDDRSKMGKYLREQVLQMHSLERLGGRLVEIFQAIRQKFVPKSKCTNQA